jgi:flavin reductase (DIM6/NTAB) family NADH-FMN oxidoreductase RutF
LLQIYPSDLHPRDAYRLFISLVVPRPIGWISTLCKDGTPNLAPYSFFNGVGGNPPTVMVSIGRRQGGLKDTLRNIQDTGDFVVNIVDRALFEAMNQTSGEYEYGVDEFELASLETAPSILVRPPRVAASPAALECKPTQIVPVEGTHYTIVIGQVLLFHIKDGLMRSNGLVDPALLNPIARLGGDEYAELGKILTLARPGSPQSGG